MEAIKSFEILLDISDRERMYDYATGKHLDKSESGGWDLHMLKGLGNSQHVAIENENQYMLVMLMDKAVGEKGYFEKHVPEKNKNSSDMVFGMDYDNMDPVQELPRRVLPIYSPGDPVKGKVILDLTEPIKPDHVNLEFLGQASVSIRIYHNKGYYDDRGTEKYVESQKILWQNVDVKSKDISEQFTSLVTTQEPQMGSEIPAGKHTFPFEFRIPQEAPQSCPPLVPSSHNHAHITYRLQATVSTGKFWGRGNAVTHKGIWVKQDYDIGKEHEKLKKVVTEETLSTGALQFWKSGKVTCHAEIPKAVFVRGEAVPVSVTIDNQTDGAIEKVKAKIVLGGKCRSGTGMMRPSRSIKVKTATFKSPDKISAGMAPTIRWDIPLDFSESSVDKNLIPIGDLSDCTLIDVKYEVRVKIERKGLHRNLELSIPITIGSKNSSESDSGEYKSLYPQL